MRARSQHGMASLPRHSGAPSATVSSAGMRLFWWGADHHRRGHLMNTLDHGTAAGPAEEIRSPTEERNPRTQDIDTHDSAGVVDQTDRKSVVEGKGRTA